MSEPSQSNPPAPEPEVQLLQGPEAAKLLKLVKRVNARKGSAVGLMAGVADQLRTVHSLFLRAAQDNTAITQEELHLLLAFTKRLARRAKELALGRISGMQEVAAVLEATSRQLDEADRGGYGIRTLQRQAEADRRLLDRLRNSIKQRVRESAAVLAELEQAVDPVPGLHLVSGRMRAKNAQARKKQDKRPPLPPGVRWDQVAPAPEPPTVTASQFLAALKPSE